MSSGPFRTFLGKLVAALVSVVFILTPMASAMHADAAPAALCEAELGAEHAGDREAGDHDHARCAHGCGTCHFHLIGTAGLHVMALPFARFVPRPVTTDNFAAFPRGGLFRPPRV